MRRGVRDDLALGRSRPIPRRHPQAARQQGLGSKLGDACLDLAIPAPLHPVFGNRSAARLALGPCLARAGHDQPAARTGEGDIQQADAFVIIPAFAFGALVGDLWRAVFCAQLPDRFAIGKHVNLVKIAGLAVGGIGQDDDGGLQPLGTVHRHHPDARTFAVHLAFYGDVIGFQPDQKPGEAWGFQPFIGEGLRQKFVDAVFGLGAKPREQAAAAIVAGQNPFHQIERTQVIGVVAQIFQHGDGFGVAGMVAQRFPEIALAGLGKGEQRGLAPAAKRRAQQGRKRQIILGCCQKGQQCRQILDSQFCPQLQPVCPRNRQTQLFTGADDLGKQRRAALHQDEKIARMRPARAFVGGNLGAGVDDALDFGGNQPGKLGRVMGFGNQIDRVFPVFILLRLYRFDQGPEVHPARHLILERDMVDLAAQCFGEMAGKGGIDQLQYRRGRAEGMLQRAALKLQIGPVKAGAEGGMLFVERCYIRALKRIDRLLFIAHHKQGAPALPCAETCGEFGSQQLYDAPLIGAGVLCLVHKDMVDAAIQPVKHPGGNAAVGQQGFGARDQIIEIQPTARGLAGGIDRQESIGELVQRFGFLCCLQGNAARTGRFDAQHQRLEPGHDRGEPAFAQRFGREIIDLGVPLTQARAEQQDIFQRAKCGHILRRMPKGCQSCPQFGVFRAAGLHGLGDIGQPFRLAAQKNPGQDRGDGFVFRDAEEGPDLRRGQGGVRGGCEIGAMGGNLLHHLGKGVTGIGAGGGGHRFGGQSIGQFFEDIGAQQPGGAVIQLDKLRRDTGFERKAAQQRGAKAVDGLDAQPAGRFDCAGKQTARTGKSFGRLGGKAFGRLRGRGFARLRGHGPKFAQGRVQRRVGFHRPFAQKFEQPVLHLGGGGLGIGQAQNMLGLHPGQQQPRHAVGQNTGFAGPRVGRKPCGDGGIGGFYLPLRGQIRGHSGLPTVSGSPTGSGLPTDSGTARSDICHSP